MTEGIRNVNYSIIIFILFGFIAQLIDGTLRMAYGVSSNTFSLSLGIPPAIASAYVHTSEMFTTAESRISHFKFGNVDKKIFFKTPHPWSNRRSLSGTYGSLGLQEPSP